jgi:alpha-galactosidase
MRLDISRFASVALLAVCSSAVAQDGALDQIIKSPSRVVLADGTSVPANSVAVGKSVQTDAAGHAMLQLTLRNTTDKPLLIREVIISDWQHGLPGASAFYGEGYTMLSQTAGTLAKPEPLNRYLDHQHYRLPMPEGFRAMYGMLTISPPGEGTLLLAFTSCRKFIGKFYVAADRIQIVVDTEGLELAPGQTWQLEELFVAVGDRNRVLEDLAARINHHHPRLEFEQLPTGWCSWYCFGPRVTAANVIENLADMRERVPQLTYVQVDDGYQPWMGDWLDTGRAFGGRIQDVLRSIRAAGREPAIWVAPFIASPQSRLFRDHADWFVKAADGKPLQSNKVTFGGWRMGPWYMLDGTHPEAQQYLEEVFRTMRIEWGCTYFKLDANAWGAMPFGRRYDPQATCVEAYRAGMAAIRRGAGDSFLLGCNHPIWPSLGEMHGSRSSADISRKWETFKHTGRENLMRNWQNNRLWWNDPDCLCLSGKLSADEYAFHQTVLYATGGMVLSGDDLTKLSSEQFKVLKQLAGHSCRAAEFDSPGLEVGVIRTDDRTFYALFNWSEEPARREVPLTGASEVTDFWSGEDLGEHDGIFVVENMPPRSGRLLVAKPLATPATKAGLTPAGTVR